MIARATARPAFSISHGPGHPAAIATVIRLSLRYQRLAQLEDGYGISLEPVRALARARYADDPAARFAVKGAAAEPLALARMHKAIAVVQWKLEGQVFARRPGWGLGHRALLRHVDLALEKARRHLAAAKRRRSNSFGHVQSPDQEDKEGLQRHFIGT